MRNSRGQDEIKAAGTDYFLSPEQVSGYCRDGFVQLDHVLVGDELQRLRDAVAAAVEEERPSEADRAQAGPYAQLFIQRVNLWRRHPAVREFVLSAKLANIAARLSGGPVRVWHDQALFKEPQVGTRTPWHQDSPYWPHSDPHCQISIWIALRDATTRNGCMAFIPGTQVLDAIPRVDLGNPRDILSEAQQFRGVKPRVCELRAGCCTLHNGLTFHYAGPNLSDQMREAFAIIYMPDDTIYSGAAHIVTDPLGLRPGELLEGDPFPIVSTI